MIAREDNTKMLEVQAKLLNKISTFFIKGNYVKIEIRIENGVPVHVTDTRSWDFVKDKNTEK